MTRTCAREIAMCICFSLTMTRAGAEEQLEQFFEEEYYATLAGEDGMFSERPDETQMEYIYRVVSGIGSHNPELDTYIEKYSTGWKFGRISRTAVSIMKTAMYEVLYMPDVPNGAAINEAVNLAKKYEEPATVPFINGVLGSFIRGEAAEI